MLSVCTINALFTINALCLLLMLLLSLQGSTLLTLDLTDFAFNGQSTYLKSVSVKENLVGGGRVGRSP